MNQILIRLFITSIFILVVCYLLQSKTSLIKPDSKLDKITDYCIIASSFVIILDLIALIWVI